MTVVGFVSLLVVVAVPVSAFPHLPATLLAGDAVVDACDDGPERDG